MLSISYCLQFYMMHLPCCFESISYKKLNICNSEEEQKLWRFPKIKFLVHENMLVHRSKLFMPMEHCVHATEQL